jgi:hypothetical protein
MKVWCLTPLSTIFRLCRGGFPNKCNMYICTCRQYHLYSDDKVCQWLATGQWFSQSTAVSSNNKIGRHDITEILLKVLSNTIILTPLYSGKLTRLQYRMSLDVIKSSKKRRKKCNTHQSLQYPCPIKSQQIIYLFDKLLWYIKNMYTKKSFETNFVKWTTSVFYPPPLSVFVNFDVCCIFFSFFLTI